MISGQTGEDPLIRQRLVAHPEWLRVAEVRLLADHGRGRPEAVHGFRERYEDELGIDKVGVEQDGRDVIQPPDWAMYPYDA